MVFQLPTVGQKNWGDVLNSALTWLNDNTVLKNSQIMWLDDQPGVEIDGITECGAAIQAAINTAEATGLVIMFARRVYVSAQTLVFKKSAEFYESTISYNGVGVGVVIGDDVSGTTRQIFKVGRVVNTAKIDLGWAQVIGSVGVKIVDTNKSDIWIKSIVNFETGLLRFGQARGCSYNRIYIGDLANNKINHKIDTGSTSGWVSQNLIFGGSYTHEPVEGIDASGTKHVFITDANPFEGDSDIYIGNSLEQPGGVTEYMIDCHGTNNQFIGCRFEAGTGGTPRVRWGAGALKNIIRDGHSVDLLQVTTAVDAINNVIIWPASGDVAELTIKPQDMFGVVGAPVLGAVERHPVMNTVNGGTQVIAFTICLPANWHTYEVEMQMVHDTAGAGSVSWTWRSSFNSNGDLLSIPSGSLSVAVVAAAQKVKKVQIIAANQIAVPNKQLTGNIFAGGGTFAGTIGILAIILRRRS